MRFSACRVATILVIFINIEKIINLTKRINMLSFKDIAFLAEELHKELKDVFK